MGYGQYSSSSFSNAMQRPRRSLRGYRECVQAWARQL